MKNNLITEELLRIRSLIHHKPGQMVYENIIYEGITQPTLKNQLASESNKFITVRAIFYGGKTQITKEQMINYDEFVNSIKLINEYITKNPKYNVAKIIIRSGESVLPGFERGKLAEDRLKTIEKYTKDNLPKGTKFPPLVPFYDDALTPIPEGGFDEYNKWKSLTDDAKKKHPKNAEFQKMKEGFLADQFNEVTIRIEPDLGDAQCIFGASIWVMYSDKKLGHVCDGAEFQIYANDVKLKRRCLNNLSMECAASNRNLDKEFSKYDKGNAVMNNGNSSYNPFPNDIGGTRFNLFKLDDENLIKTISNNSKDDKVVISYKCAYDKCHQDAFHIIVKDSSGIIKANTYGRGGFSAMEGIACILDRCMNQTEDPVTPSASSDVKNKPATSPESQIFTFQFPSLNTLTNAQYISNIINSGYVTPIPKKPNYYRVMSNFTVKYKEGDKEFTRGSTLIMDPKNVTKVKK